MTEDRASFDTQGARSAHKLLSVIVPVFDERATVAEIVRRMRGVHLDVEVEIIMVDDGSTDGTEKILGALEDSTLQVVRHPVNRGKGAAIRTGLTHARGDLVIVQDADLEYDPDDWARLLRPVLKGRAQVVYGSRFTGEGQTPSLGNWASNRLMSMSANLLYGATLSDVGSSLKLFERRVLDGITLECERFDFEVEVTAKVLRAGYRIYEVPISHAKRSIDEGQKFVWRDNVRALGTLVRHRLK
ncbi:MAG: glycosyltransferase family 2 protein [Acidimicrobiales bacterium]